MNPENKGDKIGSSDGIRMDKNKVAAKDDSLEDISIRAQRAEKAHTKRLSAFNKDAKGPEKLDTIFKELNIFDNSTKLPEPDAPLPKVDMETVETTSSEAGDDETTFAPDSEGSRDETGNPLKDSKGFPIRTAAVYDKIQLSDKNFTFAYQDLTFNSSASHPVSEGTKSAEKHTIKIGVKSWDITGLDLKSDYDQCFVEGLDENKGENYIFTYERLDAKNKRLETDCAVMTFASVCQKNDHILTWLACGELPELQIRYHITNVVSISLPEYQDQQHSNIDHFVFWAIKDTFECLEDLHRSHFVHRNLKPSNFKLSRTHHKPFLHLVNLGLAHMYRRPVSLEPIPFRETVSFFGSLVFASRSAHLRMERTTFDDFEGWFYIVCELFCPRSLPWRVSTDRNCVLKEKMRFFTETGFKKALQGKIEPRRFEFLMSIKRALENVHETNGYVNLKRIVSTPQTKIC